MLFNIIYYQIVDYSAHFSEKKVKYKVLCLLLSSLNKLFFNHWIIYNMYFLFQ